MAYILQTQPFNYSAVFKRKFVFQSFGGSKMNEEMFKSGQITPKR